MTGKLVAIIGLTLWMTLCDRFFHVSTDTVEHFWSPFMGDQTVWVLACFGVGSVGLVMIAPRFATPTGRPARFGAEVLLMTAIYAISGYAGADHPTLVTTAFAALFIVRVIATADRTRVAVVALALAVTGPVFESVQWQLGMFEYTRPDVIGVPWWLFPFYANGAWAVRELGALLVASRAQDMALARR